MPLKYRIFPEARLVHVVGSAVVDYLELIEHLNALAADPDYQTPMKKLIDYRSIRVLALSQEELASFNQIKDQLQERFRGEQCAIVSSQDLNFRVTRNHSQQIDPEVADTRPFKSLAEAHAWLELDNIPLPRLEDTDF